MRGCVAWMKNDWNSLKKCCLQFCPAERRDNKIMIKLLAVDMDGTCLDRQSRMTDRTIEALRAAARKGIMIVPATGRNLGCIPYRLAAGTVRMTGTEDDRRNNGMFRYVISSNGAEITDVREKKSVFRAHADRGEVLSLLDECTGKGFGIAAHIRYRYLIQGRFLTAAGVMIYGKDAKGVCCVRDMKRFIRRNECGVEELQLYFLFPGAKAKLRSVLRGYPSLQASYTGIYAEIYSEHASKGLALAALAERLKIRREEMACIGDGENDLSMFDVSGLRIAMGNATDSLKFRADYIADTNSRDGAAKAIEKYIL